MSAWPTARLSDLASISGTSARNATNLPVYSVTKHRGFVASLEYFTKQVFSRELSTYTVVEPGEFAYATIHLDEGSIGICPERCLISPMYTAFRVSSQEVLPAYLLRYLKSSRALAEYPRMGKGSVERRRAISFERLGRLDVPLPPLAEQARIAEILDRAEGVRAKRLDAIVQLDALAQSVFLDLFGDPAMNPKGFPKATLGDIIDFVGGSQPPREVFTYESSPDTIRLVQIRDFKSDEFITYIPRRLAKRFFEPDDVMIGRYGPPVFQILRGLSGSYNVALIKALPKGEVLKDFIFYLLQEPRLHSHVVARSERTAGQSGVNLELLENYPAYLPPLPLQRKFSRIAASIELLKTKCRASLGEFDALFASLQYRAFQGGI